MSGNLAASVVALSLACSTVAYPQSHDNPAESRLTFLSHRSGHNVLYQSQLDGSNLQAVFGGPITEVPSFDNAYMMYREPHWTRQSPNGKYFASWVYEKGQPYSRYQGAIRAMLWVGDLEGKWTRVVTPDCHEEFAWSPDSKQIAFSVLSHNNYDGKLQNRIESTQVFIVGVDGSHEVRVLERKGKWFVLDWSPDGDRLLLQRRESGKNLEDTVSEMFEFRLSDALKSRSHLQTYDPDWEVEQAPKFLSRIESELDELQVVDARYSPTRNEIALVAVDPNNMYAPNLVVKDENRRGDMMRLLGKVYIVDRDTKEVRKIAAFEEGIRGPICWSPDGDEVLFSRFLPADDERERLTDSHGLAIWAVSRDGTKKRFVTTGWSPDCPRLPNRGEKKVSGAFFQFNDSGRSANRSFFNHETNEKQRIGSPG